MIVLPLFERTTKWLYLLREKASIVFPARCSSNLLGDHLLETNLLGQSPSNVDTGLHWHFLQLRSPHANYGVTLFRVGLDLYLKQYTARNSRILPTPVQSLMPQPHMRLVNLRVAQSLTILPSERHYANCCIKHYCLTAVVKALRVFPNIKGSRRHRNNGDD